MKHYLHKFANQAAYTTAKAGQDFYLPAVSLIENGMSVIYDSLPVVPEGFVDFGLPSGTLWYSKNLGATNGDTAESWYGNYYAWGETTPHDGWPSDTESHPYDWNEYKYAVSSSNELTKYVGSSTDEDFQQEGYNGFVDNLTKLVPTDDAATHNNQNWSMPTIKQFEELIDYTTYEFVTSYQEIEGLNGVLFTGYNVTKQPFKNITLYLSFGGEISEFSDDDWEYFSNMTLLEINAMLSEEGIEDITSILYKDASGLQLAEYGVDYNFIEKTIDSTKKMFLPAAGHIYQSTIYTINEGHYWGSELQKVHDGVNTGMSSRASHLIFRIDDFLHMGDHGHRCEGRSVRPVITPAS